MISWWCVVWRGLVFYCFPPVSNKSCQIIRRVKVSLSSRSNLGFIGILINFTSRSKRDRAIQLYGMHPPKLIYADNSVSLSKSFDSVYKLWRDGYIQKVIQISLGWIEFPSGIVYLFPFPKLEDCMTNSK